MASCGTPAPPPPPVTVTSVDGWGLLTLSNGNRVYDTSEPNDLGYPYDACEADYILRAVRTAMLGRQVTHLARSTDGPYGSAPAGYVPANVDIAGVDSRGVVADHDYWTEARESNSAAALAACEPPETSSATPETTTTSAPSGDTYVDVEDDDDDGESRFCRRRAWC